jgi:hypothetical protein
MVRRDYCAGAGLISRNTLNARALRARQAQGSCVESELIDAYLQARYWVQDSPSFCLKVGQDSGPLRQIYRRYGVECAAFITAFNPEGVQANAVQNGLRHAQLQDQIRNKGYTVLRAMGCDPKGVWQAEQSVLVPGLGLAEATEIGRNFRQNAIVWCGPESIAQLVLLR